MVPPKRALPIEINLIRGIWYNEVTSLPNMHLHRRVRRQRRRHRDNDQSRSLIGRHTLNEQPAKELTKYLADAG